MSEFEPYPVWDCNHEWMYIGPTVVSWIGTGTNDKPPDNAPLMQKVKCLKCHGYSWQYLHREASKDE